MVAAHESQREAVLGNQRQCFDRFRQCHTQQFGYRFAGGLRRGRCIAQIFGSRAACAAKGECFRHFDIGRVIRSVGKGDGVFAGIGQHMEFMRGAAADGAGIGIDRAEAQAEPGEDAAVGIEHDLIGLRQAFRAQMEGIGILHQELARAHDAEARADFIAEFGLDLVEIQRQLFVAA